MKNGGKLKDEVDDLFKLPLAEFIDARNALAKRLKQSGRADDANLVKTLTKPSVSAWTVNQLYWNHRVAFDRLLAAGQRFHKAQASGLGGKVADLRGSLEARREALVRLSELAESLLSEAGHNPSPDTIRRVTTTLEAISAQASASDGPTLGRLSQDVDPPGFELLASFVSDVGSKSTPAPARASQKSTATTTNAPQKAARNAQRLNDKRQTDEKRQADRDRQARQDRQIRIAAAKLSVQAAKRSLIDARTRAQSLDAAHKKANAEAKEAEKRKREAEERFKHASGAAEEAAKRVRSVAEEATAAAEAVEKARRTVEQETKELEALFSELR